uniref:Uncharacterized protein n=1 Tax=Ditylenchus dipsaci TaxID=166011 RepID=A0A915EUC5_9BILA
MSRGRVFLNPLPLPDYSDYSSSATGSTTDSEGHGGFSFSRDFRGSRNNETSAKLHHIHNASAAGWAPRSGGLKARKVLLSAEEVLMAISKELRSAIRPLLIPHRCLQLREIVGKADQ